MPSRTLLGPIAEEWAHVHLAERIRANDIATFDYSLWRDGVQRADGWQWLRNRCPAGWQPDRVVLMTGPTSWPAWLQQVPVPVVALLQDAPFAWHLWKRFLPDCDFILADAQSTRMLRGAGIESVAEANWYDVVLPQDQAPSVDRDIDVLYADAIRPDCDRQQRALIGYLQRLMNRFKVRLHLSGSLESCLPFLARSKTVVMTRANAESVSILLSGMAHGALAIWIGDDRDCPRILRGNSLTLSDMDQLEKNIVTHAADGAKRTAAVDAGKRACPGWTIHDFWTEAERLLDSKAAVLGHNMQVRLSRTSPLLSLNERAWQAVLGSDGPDGTLIRDLATSISRDASPAHAHYLLGLVIMADAVRQDRLDESLLSTALDHFQRAWTTDERQVLAGLALAQARFMSGNTEKAMEVARKCLADLDRGVGLAEEQTGACPPTIGSDRLRWDWERSAWNHVGDAQGEDREKRSLLRAEFHLLLAELTGKLHHYYETVLTRPDLPSARAALGCALARQGQTDAAIPHLRHAVNADPLDEAAARALYVGAGEVGDLMGQRRIRRDRWLLYQAAPDLGPPPDWCREASPTGDELVSIIVVCGGPLRNTRHCIESVLRHSRRSIELLLVDHGSEAATLDYLRSAQTLCEQASERYELISGSPVAFAVACNSATRVARGHYVALLRDDTIVTDGWLEKLIEWTFHDWPRTGIVGPVSCAAPGHQRVAVDYGHVDQIPVFARSRATEFALKGALAERLGSYCLVVRRDVMELVGTWDEQFRDEQLAVADWCLRAQQLGRSAMIALDTYVHHSGSDSAALDEDVARFAAKWGPQRVASLGIESPETGVPEPSVRLPSSWAGVMEISALAAGHRPRVSLCMIVKNEEHHLPDCLASASDLVDEIIIVDTGSSDRTKEIAGAFGAHVFDLPWPDSFAAARHRHAVQLLCNGKAPEAIALLRVELQRDPGLTMVRHDLAVALAGQGQIAEAIAETEQVTRELPAFLGAWSNLGQLLIRVNRLPEGIAALERVVKHQPDHVDSYIHLSAAYKLQGQWQLSLERLQQAMRFRPTDANLWLKKGVLEAQQKRPTEALASYREALRHKPEYPEALNNLGVLMRELGDPDDAIKHLQQSVQLRPAAVKTWINLGMAYADKKQAAEAQRAFEEALRLQPSNAEAHNNLGNLQLAQGRIDEAMESFQQAVRHKSDYAEAYSNLGVAFGKKGLLHQAIAFFDQALHWNSQLAIVHLNKAIHCLAAGDFERGWSEYEWRWRTGLVAPRSFAQPAWDGSSLQGRTILLHCEQGVGDTLQFIRYARLLKECGARVCVECRSALTPLLSTCSGIDQLVAQGSALPAFDIHAPLLSLPRLFRTVLATIPHQVPYLHAEADRVERWKRDMAAIGGYKVGIAWQGSPKHTNDAERSIPLSQFAPLADIAAVRLVSLQKGPGEEQLRAATFPVHRLPASVDAAAAFTDTAAVMKQLDLMITADTAIAHLAGALGLPVWLALSTEADWRWLRDRDDSPWYPTARLFRQKKTGEWGEVFQRIGEALRKRLAGDTSGATPPSAYDRAMQLVAQQDHGEAIPWFQQAAVQQPQSFDTLHNLGVAQVRKGQIDEAIDSFTKALEVRPESPEARSNLGLVYLQKGKNAEAILCFRKALEHKPNSPEFLNNLGTALMQQKHLDEAIQTYQKAVAAGPQMVDAFRNLAFAHRLKKDFAAAQSCYEQAIRLKPERASLYNELGATLLQDGRREEAMTALKEAVRREPNLIEAWNNLAVTLSDLNRLDEAVATLEEAIKHNSGHFETQRNLAIIRLTQGDLERGFRDFEWRWQCPKYDRRQLAKPRWDGSDLAGRTILLHAEQGLGDTLQFIRYAPLVKARGGRTLVECQKPLLSLLSRSVGIDQLVARGDPLPEFDVYTPFMSLPPLLGTTLTNIPADVPYIHVDPLVAEKWQRHLHDWPGFKIGIAWQGNPKYGGDKHRSIPLSFFTSLAEIPGVRLVSLQKGFGGEQIAKLQHASPLLDLDRLMDNPAGGFMDTAAVMQNVDLVITSDTAIPHLAGALGVPTWIALSCNCDWRWLRTGESTPWYPSVRLFRQASIGDWADVFSRISSALHDVVTRRLSANGASAPVAPGELLDKITILQIKQARIEDSQKRQNVERELAELTSAQDRFIPRLPELDPLVHELKQVNEMLWDIEDDIRDCERQQNFGPRFIELARSVYQHNDRRAALKRRINECLGSLLIEEKSYAQYR